MTGEDLHVVPNGDHIQHTLTDDCVCGPTIEPAPIGSVTVHHSLDGRERTEESR